MLERSEPDLPMFERPAEQREEPQGEEQAGQDKYKVVSIRMRKAEYESFCDQVEAHGLTRNLALRIAARRIGGFLEVDHAVRQQLEAVLAALGDISRDIRQLHADYVSGGVVDLEALAAQRAAFGQEFAQLDALLRSILNVSQRRSDGRQKLAEAMT